MLRIVTIALTLMLVACDEPETPPYMCVPEPEYDYSPGNLWGPCLEDGTCTEGTCDREPSAGEMCVQGTSCPATGLPDCGPTISHAPELPCFPACEGDDDCVSGLCHNGACLWPID